MLLSCSGLLRAALRKGVLEAPHWNNLLMRGKEGAAELLWAALGCSGLLCAKACLIRCSGKFRFSRFWGPFCLWRRFRPTNF